MAKYVERDTRVCEEMRPMERFAPSIHQPGGFLNSLSSPWPFAQWGLDIVGPFPKAVGNKRYLLVSTDYFTKWVEVEPLEISGTWMPRDLFGKILSFGLESFVPSSQTTVFSLIARPSRGIAMTWA